MLSRKANEPQFLFVCGTMKTDTFQVADFTGRDSISSPYDFSITLVSRHPDITADDIVNRPASLFIFRDGEYYPYSGIVSEFRFLDTSTDFSTYGVRLVPRLWLLNLNSQTRVFQNMTVEQIVRSVFADAAMGDYARFDLGGPYPRREYVVQYQESDLNFVSRLLENAGIWYLFTEPQLIAEEADRPGAEKLIISDQPSSFEKIGGESTVLYRAHSGLNESIEQEQKESVYRLIYDKRVIPQQTFTKNYNYRTPEVDLSASVSIAGGDTGRMYRYGGDFTDTDGARKAADVQAGRLASGQVIVNGSGNCRGLRAGKRFSIEDHHRTELNDTCLVRDVIHTGSHTPFQGQGAACSYSNDFTALPSSKISSFKPRLKAFIPRISGVITAAIEANGSEYAALDDMGRYKVRMPFDLSQARNYEASKYVRLAQPYSGTNYGFHFPSHEGAEMVLACIDGNPDKPVGLSVVPNANTLSPVVASNNHQNIVRTAGGNEIVLDDTDGKQKVRINTKAMHSVEMDDEAKTVTVKSTDANALVIDDKNERVTLNAKGHAITMSYKGDSSGIVIATKEGNTISIDDANKRITLETKAGHAVQMDDDGKKITLADCAGKNTVTLDGNGGLVFNTKGKIEITAQQDCIIKAANVKITANAALEARATSDLTLKGMNIEAKADMNAKVNGGMNLEIKGGMSAKLDGMMTDVNGSTLTKVKGAMVMIN